MKTTPVLALAIWAMAAGLQGQTPSRIVSRAPERPDTGGRSLFYLHGRIVEDQGPDAVSPEYGRYEYAAILERLASDGFTVISEVRPSNTDPEGYADGIARQIEHLLASGGVRAAQDRRRG